MSNTDYLFTHYITLFMLNIIHYYTLVHTYCILFMYNIMKHILIHTYCILSMYKINTLNICIHIHVAYKRNLSTPTLLFPVLRDICLRLLQIDRLCALASPSDDRAGDYLRSDVHYVSCPTSPRYASLFLLLPHYCNRLLTCVE